MTCTPERSVLVSVLTTILSFCGQAFSQDQPADPPLRVACLGDSITAGARVDATTESYPAQLQKILGNRYEVRNFGIGGATLIRTGQPNIWRNLDAVKKFEPQVAIISLGTNDTVSGNRKNWEHIDRFDEDYAALITTLAELPSLSRIVVCTPTAMVLQTPGLSAERLANLKERKPRLQELCGRIRKLAKKHSDRKVSMLELNAVLKDRPELVVDGDGVHPNAKGYRAIAEAVAEHLLPREQEPQIPTDRLQATGGKVAVTDVLRKVATGTREPAGGKLCLYFQRSSLPLAGPSSSTQAQLPVGITS